MTEHSPEILAPAGNWDCVRAAVANGAHAVYFGLDQFNARMRADRPACMVQPQEGRHLCDSLC